MAFLLRLEYWVLLVSLLVSAQSSLAEFTLAETGLAKTSFDRDEFRRSYFERFPGVPVDDYVYGVYAIDINLRQQWQALNDFPPYEFALDEGRILAEEAFLDGGTLAQCLGENAVQKFPYFNEELGEVLTLGNAVNECRVKHGLAKLSYQKQDLANLLAYLTFLERGTRRGTPPPASENALQAYQRGKDYFYTKRGQLNLSCADCHIRAVGQHLREQTLAPLLGVVNHYPVYGLRQGAMGSLHQRFVGCVEQVRGEADHLQSQTFKELEYFLAIMADGLPIIGPMTQR